MIIWILNHYAISPNSIGGTRHFDLAYELVKSGHKVRIFSSSFNHFEKKETVKYTSDFYKEEVIEQVDFTWIKTPSYIGSLKRVINIAVFSMRLSKVLNDYLKIEKPDVIIGSSVHPLTPIIGFKKAQKNNSLFYFEERDLWPQTFIDFGILSEKNMLSKILFKMEKHLYKNSDKVIFLFENAHKYALTKGLMKSKTIYLPNGYSTQRVTSNTKNNEIEKILIPLKGKKICIYIGSFGEANHMFPLFELAQSMKNEEDYHFLFIGDGLHRNSLIEFVKKTKLKNTTILNPISKSEIPYILSHAYCGLISMKDSPLYKWGFSMNKIYDYLSIGLPIIMYSSLESVGHLEESKGIFHSNSIEQLKNMLINATYSDREHIKKFAFENYSWEVLKKKLLLEINEDLMSKKF
ncbi:glycosyltransferase family 4 protein [Psychrobacillus sp. NPDC096389]|uniref:glycosyltransferase family 4 protein n=1 Tax=Psychrobacillus sp. NPDC096389 TaxID=3364490 RepID=UPI00382D4233